MTRKQGRVPPVDCAVAGLALTGQDVSGDLHLVQPFDHGVLVAAVDGLGHGPAAASAARAAVATLAAHAHESVVLLLKRCHEELRETRGAVLTLASFNIADET